MIVKGRDHPYVTITTGEEFITVRVDFALKAEVWAEINLTVDEVEYLLTALKEKKAAQLEGKKQPPIDPQKAIEMQERRRY